MALIKCPECGRENVSETAEACPNCGFGIKNHFLEIKKAEEKRQLEIEQKRREKKLQEEANKKREAQRIAEQRKIDNTPTPAYPIEWIGGMLFSAFLAFAGIVCIAEEMLFLGIFMIFMSIILGLGSYINFSERLKIYNLSKTDMHAAKASAIAYEKSLEDTKRQNKANREARKLASMYKCPQCGKQAGKQISIVSKSISVEMVGLASNKIGKSYKCSSCGYMW